MSRNNKNNALRLPGSLALLTLAAGVGRVFGQVVTLEQAPTWNPPQVRYLRSEVEMGQVNYQAGNASSENQHLNINAGAGIGWDYFLYHPNLFTFSLLGEPGYTWQQFNNGGQASSSEGFMLNGNFNGTLLQSKPYAATVSYARSHDNYQYDFFNSSIMDLERWGMSTGYREGPVPVTVSLQHSQTDSSGLNYNSTMEQTILSLNATSLRKDLDHTELSYQFNTYAGITGKSVGSGGYQNEGASHYLLMNDLEHFGKKVLSSSLFFNHLEMQGTASDSLNLGLDYQWEHTPHLKSSYDYSLGYYSSGSDSVITHAVSVGLQHQLYESLSSAADVHGSNSGSDSSGSQSDSQSVGVAGSVTYSKKLGQWANLTLSDGAGYDLTHDNSGGQQQFIADESHNVPAGNLPFYLSQPRDVSVSSITYFNGTTTDVLIEGPAPFGDYEVISTTDPWQIRVYTTGPHHVIGPATVKVSYTIQSNPTGDYGTFNNVASARLGFWNQRADVYASYGMSDNQSSTYGFVFNNYSEFQTGADLMWNRFWLNAAFTVRESSLYNYQALNLSEGYTILSTYRHTLSLDLHQMQTTTSSSDLTTSQTTDQTYYSATCKYRWTPFAALSWNSEAGVLHEDGSYHQDGLVFRSHVSWLVGKLTFQLSYEFERQEYTAETRGRNYVYLQMRRSF